jgi:Spermine/spermidine synthase domain
MFSVDRATSRTLPVFLISVLALFLEMLLIRWIGTEIRIFAYLQNTILVVSFLGLGLGCFTCTQPARLRQTLVPLTVLLLLLAIPATRETLGRASELLSLLSDFVIWGNAVSTNRSLTIVLIAMGLAIAYLVLILVVDIFVPVGRVLGRLLNDHPHAIRAYSANIAGSLVGTWLFVLLSFFYAPPVAWFAIVCGLSFVFIVREERDRRINAALLFGIFAFACFAGHAPGAIDVVWSPYQKLVLRASSNQREIGDYLITVNNTGYQMMADLRASHAAADGKQYPPEFNGLSQYDLPPMLHPNPRRYLIVGAGAGNDAAGGLRHGVQHTTAVEIDPAIIAFGRRYHPEHPYDSPAVHVVNDDARSFFARTNERFDVITFGLLDSHTTTAMTNARLDHYVYTRESITRVASLLADGGIIVLSFEAQKPYIADRMAGILRDVFGESPLAFRIPPSSYGWGGVIFVAGDLAAAKAQMAGNPRLGTFVERMREAYPLSLTYRTRMTTDDWPYLYLESAKIPTLYYLLTGLMVLILIRSARRWEASDIARRWTRMHWHFFFLGAAFLLLEVQNVSKASVVLGNTWLVNAVIVSGVLAMALLANWLASRFPAVHMGATYIALVGICVGLYFVDLARFAFLSPAMKALVVGGLTTLPMLFSGLVFVRSFAAAERKDEALGANLVGALCGALVQSLTFVTGIKALLLIVAACYLASLVTLPARTVAVAYGGRA